MSKAETCLQKLATLLGLSVPWLQLQTESRLRVYRHRIREIRVSPDGSSVDLQLYSLSPQAAEAVVRVLARHTNA